MPPDEIDLSAATTLKSGMRLLDGRYELVERLGSGGMGEVFRARDLDLRRDVAIKRLLPSLIERGDLVQRAEREGQILASLRHPAIIDVFDMKRTSDGGLLLILELVPGTSLATELRHERRLPWARCVEIGTQVCGALAAAHAAGVIHRDVKPGNILVSPDGTVHVADFGIARLAGATGATVEGAMIGTPGYWAPEQATRGEVTPLSDLYSLCCVLFEAACGRAPFVSSSESPAAVFVMHVVEPVPDPHAFAPDLPPAARALLMRGLAKEPGDRYPSVAALGTALEATVRLPDTLPAAAPPTTVAAPPPTLPASPPTVVGPPPTPATQVARPERAASAPAPPPLPSRTRVRRPLVVAGAVVAAAVGAGIGLATAPTDHPAAPPPTVVGTRTTDVGHLRATIPADWEASAAGPGTRGAFHFTAMGTAGPRGSSAADRAVIGTSTATGPRLLPEARGPKGAVVRMLGDARGYRYGAVPVGGASMTAYVAPTTDGVATVLCPAAVGEEACGTLARLLTLHGARAFGLVPDAARAGRVRQALGAMNAALRGSSAIGAATTPAAQADAARVTATALGRARAGLPAAADLSPAARPAFAALRGAIGAEAAAFGALASAADGSDASAWSAASRRARSARGRIASALGDLRAVGYTPRP
jgi:eukaryotic-like serine/threonine-protein kinase